MLNDTEILEGAVFPTGELTGRRYKIRLIEGNRLGSTGYYPAETLLRDGPKIFKKGTPMFLNHQTPEERAARPFGSLQDFAGELAEDAYYDGDGLYADIEVFEHEMPRIKALKDRIGISIRARGKTVTETINGQAVPVFRELVEARSVDFVRKAGAGGKIVSILESATEDSETDSETQEERQVVMDQELREAFAALAASQVATNNKLSEIAESLSAVATVEAVATTEVAESAVDVLAVAKELADSELSEEGRERVLERFGDGKGKPLAELISAEEAYVKKAKAAAEDTEGIEESATTEAQESAVKVPSFWNKK